jgi:Protein of unknown function (DUF1592)/Protein of unknown function (DUF1588)/Protein of unknown function (DUF1587)/Protein of unknown function (DUF1585)/Protein of unknown function (DUF1595)/Ca-dependent carbohydrate-binding module xylan-binding/Cytochrome C oxidase, cbb3-type, subunit III
LSVVRCQLCVVAALGVVACALVWGADAAPKGDPAKLLEDRFAKEVRPVLAQYCFGCHGNGKKKGDVALDKYTSAKAVLADRKVWKTVGEVLEQGLMPPENKPQPSDQQRAALVAFVDGAVNELDCSGPRDPGRVTIRRLNRNEYNNTIRDLVGVDFKPAAEFPADDTGYGFDNIADVLSMSPLLVEKYLSAADEILERVYNRPDPYKAATVRYVAAELRGDSGAPFDNSAWKFQQNGQAWKSHEIAIEGDYEIRVRAYQEAFGDEAAKMVVRVDDKDLETFEVKATERKKSDSYSIRQHLSRGKHKIGAAFINNAKDDTNADKSKRGDRNLVLLSFSIEGPFNAKPGQVRDPLKELFFVTPGSGLTEAQAARQIIERFATRAFRRPVTKEEGDRLIGLYLNARREGETYETAVRVPLTAVLVSPYFLYRIEPDRPGTPGTVRALNDYELATRLSYFLWSGMPDEELMTLAGQGKLKDAAVLEKQVKRMLADGKASEFVRNFVGQWLELRNLESHEVDGRRFRRFGSVLRTAMRRETELFFESIMKEDRSVLEFLTADYTFVNEPLAQHYGLKNANVKGDEDFVKVSLAGTPRRGVLTQGSILTLTAMPTRTSPVKRGVFILEQILGTPPPPPPPNVPPLADKPADEQNAPLRERLAKHRADPTCASCHVRMDGLGFALENFDPVGQWRDQEGRFPVDSTGELVGGKKIKGAEGLRELLVSRKSDFVRCLAEKMLTYALGRGIEEYDRCTVKDITREVEKSEYRFSGLVMGIVKSEAFMKRRSKRAGE